MPPPSPPDDERPTGRDDADPASVLTPDVDPGAQARAVDAESPTPDLHATGQALARPRARSVGVTVLAVLAVLYTLHLARDFLLPIAFALLLDFFFSPLVRALARWRIRPPLGAAIVVLGTLSLVGVGAYGLAEPMQEWTARAPATLATAQEKLGALTRPLERVSRTAEQVQRATASTSGTGQATPEVVVRGPSLVSRIFGTTQRLVVAVLETMVLLYFLLAAGDLFLQKLVKVLPSVENKQTAVQVARKIERSISTYLLSMTGIAVGEGIVVAALLWLIGLPNPLLWGALVVVLEFIPYVGAATMVVVLSLAGLTAFDSVGQAMLAPAAFLAVNLVQANFVAPLLFAERLTLNPVAIIVGLALWWRLWGIPGAFVAVPLLAAFKILCDHVAALAPIGEFLGQRDERERRAVVRATSD